MLSLSTTYFVVRDMSHLFEHKTVQFFFCSVRRAALHDS